MFFHSQSNTFVKIFQNHPTCKSLSEASLHAFCWRSASNKGLDRGCFCQVQLHQKKDPNMTMLQFFQIKSNLIENRNILPKYDLSFPLVIAGYTVLKTTSSPKLNMPSQLHLEEDANCDDVSILTHFEMGQILQEASGFTAFRMVIV